MTESVSLQLQAFNVLGYTFMLTLDVYKTKKRKKEKNSFRDYEVSLMS